MATSSDKPAHFRIIDLETTGTTANDAVVEIGAVDVIGREVVTIRSDLVRPFMPIPPQASAIHHITDVDVSRSPSLRELLPFYMDEDRGEGVDAFVAHKWAFKAQWLEGHPEAFNAQNPVHEHTFGSLSNTASFASSASASSRSA